MAIDFTGASNYVNLGSAAHLDNIWVGGATAMLYLNAASLGGGSLGRMMNKSTSGGVDGWFMYLDTGPRLSFFHDWQFQGGIWQGPTTVALDTDIHVAVTYTKGGVADNPKIYYDGQSVTVTENQTPAGASLHDDSARDLGLGNRSDYARSHDGLLWDARLYDHILTDAQIQSIYEAKGKDNYIKGLLGRWPMFGETGQVPASVLDVSSYADDGVDDGSTTYAEDNLAGNW